MAATQNCVHGCTNQYSIRAWERTERQNQQVVVGVGKWDGRVQRPKDASLGSRRPGSEETACRLPVDDGSNSLELLPFRTLGIGLSIQPLLRSHDNALAATCSVLLFFTTVHASSLSWHGRRLDVGRRQACW